MAYKIFIEENKVDESMEKDRNADQEQDDCTSINRVPDENTNESEMNKEVPLEIIQVIEQEP